MTDFEDNNYTEISPNEILHRSKGEPLHIIRDKKITDLPLSDLTWEEFEDLCLRLFNQESQQNNTRTFRYGRKGQAQQGFDLVAHLPTTGKSIRAECKKVESLTVPLLNQWIQRFLEGNKVESTCKFYLMTTFDIQSDTKLIEAWHEIELRFEKLGIEREIWDYSILINKLQSSRNITEVIFGPSILDRFCLQSETFNQYPSPFKKESISKFDRQVILENTTCKLSTFLPTVTEPNVSCLFEFSRYDLNGMNITCDSKFLLKLIQFRRHSNHIKECNIFYKIDQTGRYVFALPTARLSLSKNELDDLDWIIKSIWETYYEMSSNLEKNWNTIKYNRFSDRKFSISLFEIERWFWSYILKYTEKYDYAKGDGDEYIFSSSSNITIYTPDNRKNLNRGFHVSIHPHKCGSIFSDKITLCWVPFEYGNVGNNYSLRDAWTPEHAYNWLKNELFPNVYQWVKKEASRPQSTPLLEKSLKELISKPEQPEFRELNDFTLSLAKYSHTGLGHRLINTQEAKEYLYILQGHFYSYPLDSPIESKLIEASIKTIRAMLETRTGYKSAYIKANLNLKSESIYEEVCNLNIADYSNSPIVLDHSLRSLSALIDDIDITEGDLTIITDGLGLLWSRFYEDRICSMYY